MKKCMSVICLIVIYASALSITQEKPATLGLIREVYYDNKIKTIDSCDELKSNPKYPKHPDSYDIVNVFDAPQNIAEYFGQRIRGWFLAPQTGNYTFRSSCNQVCELYLSNDTDPQNKVLIINQTDRSDHNNFFNSKQIVMHEKIHLCANSKYYIEALMANDVKYDHLSIAVVEPGGSLTQLQPISMNMLSRIRIENCSVSCKTSEYETCIFENNVFGICTCKNEQIVDNNQVICQVDWNEWSHWSSCNKSDGIGFMNRSRLCSITNSYKGCFGSSTEDAYCDESCPAFVESFFTNQELPIQSGKMVAIFQKIYEEFAISFEVKPILYHNEWRSVIHFLPTRNISECGKRNTGIFFSLNTSGNAQVISGIFGSSYNNFITKPLPLLRWSAIKISQELFNGSYLYSISVNKTIVYSIVNNKTVSLSNVKVYASDPWYQSQSGFLRSLNIITGANGIFHQWSVWSYCNVSCGHGWQNRTRAYCMTEYWKDNPSTNIDFMYCFSNDACKVNWSQWSNWSECDVSSNKLLMNRTRTCVKKNPYEWCSGNSTELSDCYNVSKCGMIDNWNDWSSCNTTCGNGIMNRTFVYCMHNGTGEGITHSNVQVKNCISNYSCEDHWTSWSHCSVPCGSGFKSRSWVCNSQNQKCLNYTTETTYCYNNESCTAEWCSWGECSKTCGAGYKLSYLNTHLETARKYKRIKRCMMQKCPVDGMWSPWFSTETCSKICGDGLIKQRRLCNNPSSAENGHNCWGPNNSSYDCEVTVICPVHGERTFWSSWSLCNQPCRGGVRVKFSNCTEPKYGGFPCNGSVKETRTCNSHECRKVSMNIELLVMNDEYISQYLDPNNAPSLILKGRIIAAINNLYNKYNKTVSFVLMVHSMKDGTDRVNL